MYIYIYIHTYIYIYVYIRIGIYMCASHACRRGAPSPRDSLGRRTVCGRTEQRAAAGFEALPNYDDDMLPPPGYPPPQHSSRHGPQRTQHTASTAATPRYPQGRRQTKPRPVRASFPIAAGALKTPASNEQALVCLSNREIVDASRGWTFHISL